MNPKLCDYTLCVHVYMCGCVAQRSSQWLEPLNQDDTAAASLHIVGVRERDGGEGVHYLLFSEFQGFPCVCMNKCVFTIGCSGVAKQPCVCTVEWGWKRERSTRSAETDTHKHGCVGLDTWLLLMNDADHYTVQWLWLWPGTVFSVSSICENSSFSL